MEADIIFTPENAHLTICRPIPLLNDELAENTEHFVFSLTTTADNVILGSLTQVTIFDDDGKCVEIDCTIE